MSKIGQKWSSFRQKFWLKVYLFAGNRVGPEVDEYWDKHYWRVVSARLAELGNSDLGLNMVKLLFFDEARDEETRDMGRDVRIQESRR